MGRLKFTVRNVLIPLFLVYFFLHIGVTTWKLFQVDSTRIGYENLRDGPLLLKGGRPMRKPGVIEAVGYGKLSAMGFGGKRKKPKQVHPVLQPKDEGVPKLSDNVKTTLITEAQSVLNKTSESSNFIYVVMINKAYERMTLNWICNTALMENVHNRTLIVTMDPSTCLSIRSQWDETIKCVSLEINNYKNGYDWGRQQYINILTLRANLMELLTANDIPYVLIETDATWFKDPLHLFANRTTAEEDYDIIIPVKGYDGGSWDTLAFDPMLVATTNGSKMFMEEMKTRLNSDKKLYDQDVMNQLCASQHNGLICRQFDYNEVADGKWYKMDETSRVTPFILNNNFNSGTKNKETKQALNGFWFLATRTNQCVISKVTKFMEKYSGR
ncbi:hypothetical protein GCK72_003825 [Caenorhabditis remanei]|uniref:Nucleotide-diphospho-sugar transferase domain-containing protein n=1 Tax=Caenorhabditis remanei TaxID=31234 RepID=A0A6A5HA16_CAERE|nr:hypothetical protein GCK72_003825 [Caenorhabditis remanei]KAF1763879.1 hypothetical protein GCK72_003825 [Caenorhabditis remanei]